MLGRIELMLSLPMDFKSIARMMVLPPKQITLIGEMGFQSR